MSEFKRENRYIVIKRSDLEKVPTSYRGALVNPMLVLLDHLPKREFLVIESDWPEYEPVWKMLQHRVAGEPSDFDRVTAERDALQQRLTATDEALDKAADEFALMSLEAGRRMDLLERDKARIDWLAEQPVDTLYLDDGRIIDIAGRIDLRDAIDAAMAALKPAEGGGDEA